MSNVLNGVLAFAGDKVAARAGALAEVARAAASGWANGDVSLMVDTSKGCNKTRTGSAVGETLQAFADVIRAERVGQRIVLAGDAPAWRVACYLPGLPTDLPEGLKGKEFAAALASWGQAAAVYWGQAVDLHIQAAKGAADAKRAAGKASKAVAAASAAGAVEGGPVNIVADVAVDQPSVNELQTQLEAVTAERDALRIGNAALSAMVATLKAEILALAPVTPHETRPTPESDLSVNAREELAALAKAGAASAIKKGKRQAVPA